MNPTARTRIAPTPSGYLHSGNAVSFLLTRELAREVGASILLRIDDLDAERVRPDYVQDIFDSLTWLGITWDEGPRNPEELRSHWSQHLRLIEAHALLDQLRTDGHVYACTCSRRSSARCDCRTRRIPFEAPSVTWRLAVPDPCPVRVPTWPTGEQVVDLHALLADPVLRQRNGLPAYQIASLSDDVHFGMTLIVRGADLLPSTACQLHLAALLGLQRFLDARFVHHPLITDAQGRKLSKSAGARALRSMRGAGEQPDALRTEAERLADKLLRGGNPGLESTTGS